MIHRRFMRHCWICSRGVRATDPAARAKPILLIVDDLEQILETPKPGETATPAKGAYTVALASIIAAFRDAETTESRLLLTSRYTFALTDGRGDDLAARLVTVPLPPMDEIQRNKQMRAAARLATRGPAANAVAGETRAALELRIKAAAGGNPGLQAILSRPLLAGEVEAASRAVAVVESYLKSGEVPEEASAAAEFFEHVSMTAFRAMLTQEETQQLRAATLFSLPVPRPVLAAAGRALSVAAPERATDRLLGLGLVDLYATSGEVEEAAVNPLAPSRARLSEGDGSSREASYRPVHSRKGGGAAGGPARAGDRPAALLGTRRRKLTRRHGRERSSFDRASDAQQAGPGFQPWRRWIAPRQSLTCISCVGADCATGWGVADIQDMLPNAACGSRTPILTARAMLRKNSTSFTLHPHRQSAPRKNC
jgi:hypothetical protein